MTPVTAPARGQFAAPQWWSEVQRAYASTSAFVLHLNTQDYAQPGRRLTPFLCQMLANREVIAVYNRSAGITFATASQEEKARQLLGLDKPAQVDQILAALGQAAPAAAPQDWPTAPGAALPMLEALLKAPAQVAVIIEYAETIMPAADIAAMPPDARTDLVTLARWPSDPAIIASGNAVFLCAQAITDLHPALRSASTGYHAVEIPLPDVATRLQFVQWYQAEMAAQERPVTMEMSAAQLANITAGLSLVQLENVFLKAEIAGALSWQLVRDTKRAIIAQEYAGLLEMLEPGAGFECVGGMEQLKEWAVSEIITPVVEGRPADMAQGVVLVGPPGTGKTYFVKALSAEIGFNAVSLSMEGILGQYVGQSERNLARALAVVRSLAPVLLFMDELDQSDVAARGNGSGNPVAKNLFSQLLRFLGEPANRGKVVFFAASNRPDLMDSALMRSGRVDAVIPVLLPEESERAAIITAQVSSQSASITDAARLVMASETGMYSSADLAALVTKARKITRRRSGTITDETDARQALAAFRPSSAKMADYYTMLAVEACNDRDLLPARYGAMLDDRAALAEKIEAAAPAPRARRQL